jgi:hypothetical protein
VAVAGTEPLDIDGVEALDMDSVEALDMEGVEAEEALDIEGVATLRPLNYIERLIRDPVSIRLSPLR